MEQESKFTIMSRLAQDIFQNKYADRVNELYKKASELHQQLLMINALQKSLPLEQAADSAEQRKKLRDNQLLSMQLMPKIQ